MKMSWAWFWFAVMHSSYVVRSCVSWLLKSKLQFVLEELQLSAATRIDDAAAYRGARE